MSNTKKKFAILGAGNLGPAQAAHMALAGYDVTLGNRTVKKMQPLVDNGMKITIEGPVTTGVAQLTKVGAIGEVMADRDVIVICVPATGHGFILRELLPHIKPHHHIVLHPGQLFGALEAYSIIASRDPALAEQVCISELESSLFTSRAPEMGRVEILAIKQHLGFASMPASRVQEAAACFGEYAQYFRIRDNVLATGLTDLNAIVHPIVTMLNAGEIDRHHSFEYYHQGVTEHIGQLVEKCDLERMELAAKLGLTLDGINDWVRLEYGASGAHGDNFYELINTNHGHDGIMAPKELYTRYIWEDLPTGVIPMVLLGRQLGVKTPILQLMWDLAKALFSTDWLDEARTLDSLGLGHLSVEQLLELVSTAKAPPTPADA